MKKTSTLRNDIFRQISHSSRILLARRTFNPLLLFHRMYDTVQRLMLPPSPHQTKELSWSDSDAMRMVIQNDSPSHPVKLQISQSMSLFSTFKRKAIHLIGLLSSRALLRRPQDYPDSPTEKELSPTTLSWSRMALGSIMVLLFSAFQVYAVSPDLKVKQTIDKSSVVINDVVTYTVVVKNEGNGPATGVELTDQLPSGASYQSHNVLRGPNTFTSTTGVWAIGSLAAGDSVKLELKAKVLAEGVWFNTAEITKETEKDDDSTPNNRVITEDDYDAICFSVPITWYPGDEFTVTIPSGYNGVQWFKNDQLITANTTGVTLNQDGSLTIKSVGTYRFTTVLANCPQGSCCPIQVVQGPYGSIGDFVWKDLNKNGVQDSGEAGVPGITVELYKTDANGNVVGGVFKTAITDANGAYKFTELLQGSYKVKFLVPANMDMSLTSKDQGGDDTKDSDAGTDGFSPKIDINPFAGGIAKDNPTIDAGLIQNYGSIGDFVWKDLNSNGQQDSGEPGVSGITVELYKTDANGTPIGAAFKTTTTDANGAYKFDLLASGDYKVKFIIPTNMDMALTTPNSGDDTKDSDASPSDGFSPKVTINANGSGIDKDNPTIDAGLIQNYASIGDFVWKDKNNNGVQDAGEVGVPGVTVELYKTDANGTPIGGAFKTTTTDANGFYSFTQLASGDYKVKFIVPANMDMGLTQKDQGGDDTKDSDAGTDGFTPKITINANGTGIDKNNPTVDAGLVQFYGSIGDFVWKDFNANGQQDGGEPGVQGITVELYKTDTNGNPQGAAIATKTTDASGYYLFDLLASGDYKVKFIIPSGMDMSFTTKDQGDDAKDSDAGTDGFSPKVTINASGQGLAKDNPTIDAGLITNFGGIGDFVWKDANGNGVQDSGEAGVQSVTVELYKTDANGTVLGAAVATTTTDANGYYFFDKLASGNYKVKFIIPSGMAMSFTTKDQGDDSKDSDAGTDGFSPKITINANGSGLEKTNTTIDAGLKNDCVTPGLQVSGDKSICLGESTSIIGYSTGNLIRWYYASTGGAIIGTSNSGEAFIVSPETTTTYYAEAVIPNNDKCPSARIPVTVKVNAKPATPVCAGNTTNVCPSSTVDLTKLQLSPTSTNGGVFEWHTGIAPSSPLVSDPSKVGAGTYYLFEKSTSGCYSNPSLVTVNIVDCSCQNPATADAGDDQTICAGGSVILAGKIGGSASSSTWTSSGTGTFTNAGSLNTTYVPSAADIAAGSITIKLTTNDPDGDKLCTPAVDALIVKINKTPEAPYQLACDTLLCLGESTKLFALSPGNTIKWYTQASGGTAIGSSLSGGFLVVTPTANTTYYAESVSSSGCVSKERTPITVKVKKCYADLAVVKTVLSPAPYTVGQTITYSLEVKNLGPVTANDVTVEDVLPSSLTYVNAIPVGQYNNTTGVWTVGTLAPTASKSLLITVTINKGGSITNTAVVKSPDNDPTKPDNDKSTVTIQVPDYADLSLSKDVSNKSPNVGDQVTYSLVVKNDGPLAATNVEVTDYLPAGVSFVSSSTMTLSGGLVKATIPSIAAGSSVTISFIAKITGEGSITNKAEITKSDQKDPDSTPGNGTGKGEDDESSVDLRSIKPCNLEPPVLTCGKTTICAGESVTFTAAGCTGTVVWSTGATGTTLTVSPTTTTTYTAYCKDGNCASADSKPMTITVIKATPPVVTCGTNTICLGGSATLTADGCVGGTVTWSNGATGTTITVSPTATTTYTATCKIGDCVSGPSNAHTISVTKVTPPVIVCSNSTICKGQNVTLKAEGCTGTVTWSTGATGASITVSPETTTSYTATCTVDNCVSGKSNELTITVGTPVAPPVVTCGKGTLCAGESVTLTASGCTGTVTWSTGATGTTLTVTPSASTSYTATCTVNGCKSEPSAPENIVVIKVTAPVISCAKDAICPGESVVLSASGCEGGVITWSTGVTGISITVSPTATTTYTATCKVGECVSTPGSKTITVSKPEPPVISCSNETICSGGSATLTAAGCAGTVTWSTGATGASITVSPTATTSYTATCKVGDCVSAPSAAKTITVITVTPPVVTCSSDTICLGGSATLTATGCAGTVTWSNGATGASITVSPTTNTSYTATCKVETCQSGPSTARTIVVISVTAPVISGPESICPGQSVTLTASGCDGGTITWSTGATTSSITVTPATTSTFTAVCKKGKCVSSVATKTVAVAPIAPPIVMASGETICAGQSVILMGLGCSGTVTWSNGATGSQITVSPVTTTSYTATCKVGDCVSPVSATRTITVTTLTPPVITCSADTVCAGEKSTLTATGCTGTVTWSNGATGASIVVAPTTTTTYTAICKVGECVSGASNAKTVVVISVTPPVISCATETICVGSSATLSATGCEGGTIVWSTGATGSTITVSPTATTTYSAICKKGKCVSEAGTKTIQVIKVEPPVVTVSAETICVGGKATLTATGCTGTVTWSTGATGASIIVSPSATTSYTATCKVGDCVSLASTPKTVTVTTPTPPVITVSADTVCAGEKSTLTATGCAGTVTWSNGATGASIVVAPTTTTTYTAICKVGECVSGASNAKTVVVISVTPPVVSCATETICVGSSATLSATGCEGGTIVWSTGATGSTITVSPTATTTYSAICKKGKCVSEAGTKTIQVIKVEPPVITCSSETICVGGSATLTATGCTGTVTWSTGATGASITVSPSATTTYTATCKVGDCVSAPSASKTVAVTTPTPPTITSSKESICAGESATLTATGCAGTVTWSNGATGASITVTPSVTTTYNAICKVGDCASAPSNSKTITIVNTTPPAITCSQEVICAGTSVTLSATGCSGTVVWSTGATGTSIIVSPTSTTAYTAVCKVGTCTSPVSETKTVQVKNPKTPVISASSTTICKGGDVTLKATGCEGTVVWSNGMTGASITVSLATTTTFSATCTIDKCTSPASDKITVTTVSPSVPVITCSTGSICPGESVTLSALGCEGTVEWSNGSTGATLTISPSVTTTYSAICKVGDCKSAPSAVATINVGNPTPPVIYCDLTSICAGYSATLKANGCSGTVVWSNGMSGNVITVSPTTTTTYTAICKGKTCESVLSNAVTVAVGAQIAKPKTTDLVNTCPLTTVSLSSGVTGTVSTTGGVFEFHVSNSPTSALVTNPNAVGNGTYYVFEKTATGCYGEGAAINVAIKDCNTTPTCATNPATADAGADASACADAGIKLAGKIGGAASVGKWTSTGTGTFDNSMLLTATYKPSLDDIKAGKVKLVLTTDDPDGSGACKAASDTLVLTVKGIAIKPTITFTGSNTRCAGDSVTLTANEGYNYKWSTGATTRSITVKASGSYSVNLMGTDGCGSVASEAVKITIAEPIAAPTVNSPKSNVCPATTVDLATMVTSQPGTGNSFQYNITNNPNSAVIVNPHAVGAGNYYVFVKTEAGCYSASAILKVNITTCSTDSTADLSIKKTADKSKVAVGSNVTYTLKVKNFGPKAATNVELKDVLPTGLEFVSGDKFTNTSGTVTAKIATLASGDSASLSFVAKVTAAGKILNTAVINKADQTDPSTSDNSSSVAINDTTFYAGEGKLGIAKSVSAAKVKDNVYDVTYTFTVSNVGGGNLTKVQVSDTLSKVFAGGATFTKPILTADAGFVVDTTYTGTGAKLNLLVDSLSNLPAGITRKITLKTTVDVSKAASTNFNNIALAKATIPASGNNPAKPVDDTSTPGDKVDPNNNGNPKDDTGTTPINLPKTEAPKAQLGLALAVIDTVKQANGSYNVTYRATLKNLGTVALSKVQVVDSLSKVFASPVTFTMVGKPIVRSGSSLVVDTTFNGATKVNLLTDSSKLAVGVLDSIRFTVNVVLAGQKGPFNNQALGKATAPDGTSVSDLSNNGFDPATSGTATTPLVFGLAPTRLGVAKTAGTPVRVGTTGRVYEIPYEIILKNYGSTDITKLSVKDDLSQVFTAKGAVISSDKIIITADAGLVVNKNFTGLGLNTELLVPDSSSLVKGESRKISFKVKVDFSASKDSVFNNVAMGKGTAANGTTSEDASQSGVDPAPDGSQNPSTFNVPTPVTVPNVVTPKASIGLALSVSDTTRQANGSFNVTYRIVVKNYGTETLKNIQLVDSLAKVFTSPTTYTIVGSPKVNAGSKLTLSATFNGNTDVKLLNPDQSTLAVGATDTIRITLNVVHDGRNTPYQSRVYGYATGSDVTKSITDISASGLNPDKNSNGNPSDPGEDDYTNLVLPAGLQELFIPEGFSPNNDGVNDLFVIRNTKGATVNLQVFNRWGNIIYTSEDYKNDWNGEPNSGVRLGSGGVPDGTYYYIVRLSDGREFIRFFTISR
ncbi:MAG: SdrD B-like domain-containing protein [Spirosomataceae bacterium]